MSGEEIKTIDTSQEPTTTSQEGEPKVATKREGVLSAVKAKVSEKELKNNLPAIRLIVEQNYKLGEDVKNLEGIKEKYYDEKEEASVLREKLNALNSKLILTTTGGILAGFLPTVWSQWNNVSIFIAVSIVAIIFLGVGFFKKIN